MSMSALAEHQELLAQSGQAPLGHLAVFTVTSGAKVTRDMLAAWFQDLGLPASHLPNPIRPADAMARALADCEERRLASGVSGQFINILARHVSSDKTTSTRQLVVEVVDATNKRLSYVPAAELTLHRKIDSGNPSGDRIDTRTLQAPSPAAQNAIMQALRKFSTLYDDCKTYFPSQTLRYVVRGLLLECGPVAVKGGVYFVLDQHRDWLQRIELLLERMALTGGEGTYLHTIAVPDTQRQRRMVEDFLREQTAEDLARLTAEVEQVLSTTGPLKTATVQDFVNRISELARTAAPFEQRLSVTLDKVREGMAKTFQQVQELMDRVEVDR